jgi:hypothetical protein
VASRHQDHFTVYEDHCKKLNIPLHPRATPATARSALTGYESLLHRRRSANLPLSQGSLDDVVTRQPRAPPFSTDGLVDYLVELVVCEDKVTIYDS